MTLNRVIAGLAVTVFMVAWAPAASAFCTVAGGCEPTPVGTLSVTFIGTGEKPAPAKFLVYPQGVPASHRNVVVSAATAPTIASELAIATFSSWPIKYTKIGTVKIEPPEPNSPMVNPTARAQGIKIVKSIRLFL